jgi:ribosomal protein S21
MPMAALICSREQRRSLVVVLSARDRSHKDLCPIWTLPTPELISQVFWEWQEIVGQRTLNNGRKMTINVKITPKNKHENADRMIRRFIKKTKKIKLMDELRDRRYFVKPSEIKRNIKRRQISENKKRVRQEKAILLEEPNYNRKKKTTRRK